MGRMEQMIATQVSSQESRAEAAYAKLSPGRGGATILGAKQLDRKLNALATRGSKRAITGGIRAGMGPIRLAMRAAVNASDASPELKREARKAIGSRFSRTRHRDVREAKVGFSVGKKAKQIKAAQKGHDERGGGGVGISAANIHWFVLGTDERSHKSGHPTGLVTNMFGDVTRLAFAGSAQASLNAARRKIQQVIEREARKKG